jgi:hypothetical protein
MLNKRLEEDKEQQKQEGYSVEGVFKGYENYLIYREGEREVTAEVHFFSYLNDVRLFINSYRKWDKPHSEELTSFDHQKITNRFVKYLSCWGGEVVLDDSPFRDLEQIKESLRRDGIEFEEHDGYVVYQADIEDERKRKDSILNKLK